MYIHNFEFELKLACSLQHFLTGPSISESSVYFVSKVPPILGPIPDPLLNWVTELSNVSAEQRWVLLTNLKAAAVYQFRVSAVNNVGEGSPSDPSNEVMLPQEGWYCLFRFSSHKFNLDSKLF